LLFFQSSTHELWARFFSSTLKTGSKLLTQRLLRDVPVPAAGRRTRRGGGGAGVLRVPRRADGAEQRGPDQNLQPFPRPPGGVPRTSRPCATCTPGWTPPSSPPTVGPTSRPPATSSSTTKRTRPKNPPPANAKSPGATAGPTTSATKSSPASLKLNRRASL